VQFVPISESDTDAILDVFNYFVEHSYAAYYSKKVGFEFPQRLLSIAARYPVLTVKDDNGRVVGFGLLHPYHPGDCLDKTAELTYFLRPECTRLGIGTKLLSTLTDAARALGVRTLLANISSENQQSLAFHVKHGFEEVARLPAIGEKFGTPFDIVYMRKVISRN
jgi:L-amino acid N-acyltransferase YncA